MEAVTIAYPVPMTTVGPSPDPRFVLSRAHRPRVIRRTFFGWPFLIERTLQSANPRFDQLIAMVYTGPGSVEAGA